jgi:Protein of unknown function (DUF1036)
MSAFASTLRACTVAGICLLALSSSARANIVFCNKFAHMVYVAIAYPQQDGSWISRGWISLNTGECSEFDSAIRVKTFYWRATSEPYRSGGRRVRSVWGERKGDAKFATWDRDNFNYWNAQNRVLKSTLEVYSRVAIETKADAISATITFEADGTNVTTTVKDAAP